MADIIKREVKEPVYNTLMEIQNKAEMIASTQEQKFKALMDSFPEDVKTKMKSNMVESAMWDMIADTPTPSGILKEREGGKGKMLEYFTEYYTVSELNRLFPGWWMDEMKTTYDPEVRTYRVEGYLMIEYPTPAGMKMRKIWAVGAAEVMGKSEDKFVPSQPDDRVKAARTEWIKLAGKWLGIGLDIYSQTITITLIREFEDRIRYWGVYADAIKDTASTIETGQGFRRLLKRMPTLEQSNKFLAWIDKAPADKQQGLWINFVKLSNQTDEEIRNSEKWLDDVVSKIKIYHEAHSKESQTTKN